MKLYTILICLILIVSCKEKEPVVTAQSIVDKAISNVCGTQCDQRIVEFKFRDKQYKSELNGGEYSLERMFKDSTNVIHDKLTNNGFTRLINGSEYVVADSMRTRYEEAVNSVHYFVQLPYGLNAPAVMKELIGETTIKAKDYYVIGVTFSEEGGGVDFDDSFVYWIHKTNYTVDYLAYKYFTNGGGIRFREAYNERKVNGIRFVDYNNYKPDSIDTKLTELTSLFEAGQLTLLSKIESEEVKVTLTGTSQP
ncbi:DUF6503 family protein [Ulvibacter antarcticus]|uniref:Deoxyribose-phosphate aldolase n=1 Tax=Ulvibacter antarcticus TaxID=442714 RepID=A0A3L9Z3J2_9FLAO|nr:DUF6503 family protein [Ulvibacter antarcticus]RMA64875.1 hypothetical protein BXY75_1760 [Ulvibacter antarcticus]